MITGEIAARKKLSTRATVIAILTSPLAYVWFHTHGSGILRSAILSIFLIAAFRGAVDLLWKRLLKAPSLFGDVSEESRETDTLHKRRAHFWKVFFKLSPLYALIAWKAPSAAGLLLSPQTLVMMIQLPMFFLFNFLIFMGPMMATGISQIRGFEPGDAEWGVKLADVRGQKEAKEEIHRVITLWQSGERFLKSGGKRERGILFLGAPGTGKTMLAKGIATGFNCPIVTIPGSGFAQTFIGMDAIIVRYMARKAKKLAAKWGGQCIVFIDEIDAVGMRRHSLGGGGGSKRDQLGGGMMGGMGGGGMALNQLLVVMDGIDSPPFLRRYLTSKFNTLLDASYLVPRRLRGRSLRLPKVKPRAEQIYFVGATNVPLEALDPALVRAGRMGRHIHFRNPTKRDRIDIFDLYLGKVEHVPELDTEHAREELARVTNGYSPAQIEQVCSLALTYAHHDQRDAFSRADVLEAMVTLEAGTALGWGYESSEEEKATAIHEAGHAVCAHVYKDNSESTRLSIRRRGQTGGHHQSVDVEERSFKFRDECIAELVWGLGAYAAEVWFYGENTQGVGGDLQQTSYMAGNMVGRWGMSSPDQDAILTLVGKRLLAAAGPTDIKLPKEKYEDEATLMGHAFMLAYSCIAENETGVEKIAERLIREKEVYGDDLVKLLESCELRKGNWRSLEPGNLPDIAMPRDEDRDSTR